MKHTTLICLFVVCVLAGGIQTTERAVAQESIGNQPRAPKTESTTPEPVQASKDAKLQKYFERYCDYTGGLGIGLVPSHTYDYKFRQHLKKTDDKELKRLFVLRHLYRDVDFAVRDFEEGKIRIGKVEYRKMTAEEKASAKKHITEMLDDLKRFDPDESLGEIARQRDKLK